MLNEKLRKLIKLQELDEFIFKIENELSKFPKQLKEFDHLLDQEKEKIQKAQENIDKLDKDRRKKERNIEDQRASGQKYQQQLFSVKTNKEYTALLHEIEEAKGKTSLLEDEVLSFMEKVDEEINNLSCTKENFKKIEQEIEQERNKILTQKKTLEQELENYQKENQAVSSKIPTEDLREYQKLMNKRNMKAVVPILNGFCSGCNVFVRLQWVAEIRTKKDILFRCENCSRYLYFTEIKEE